MVNAARTPAGRTRAVSVLVCCALVAFLDGFDTQAIAPAAPEIARELGLAPSAMGPVFSASQIGFLIGAFLFGPLGDRHGRKRTLLLCTGLFAAGTLVTAFADSMPVLLVCRLVAGLGLGGASPNFVSLVGEFAPPERRARAITMLWAMVPLGGMTGAFAGAALLPTFGWHSIFLVGAIAPLPVMAAVAWLVPESREVVPQGEAAPVSALFAGDARRATAWLWLASFMTWTTLVVTALWMPTLLQRAGWSLPSASSMLALNNGGGVIGALVVGALIGHEGAGRALRLTLVSAAVAILLMGFALGSGPLFAALALAAGFAASAAGGAMLAVSAETYPPAARSTGVGWALGVGRIGTVIGPLAVGGLIGAGAPVPVAFTVLAAVALSGAGAAFILGRIAARNASAGQPRKQPGD